MEKPRPNSEQERNQPSDQSEEESRLKKLRERLESLRSTSFKMLYGLRNSVRTALTGEKPAVDHGKTYFDPDLEDIIEGQAGSNYGLAGGYEAGWDNQEYWQSYIDKIKQYILEQLEANPEKTEFKVLDIGTAFGYLLKYLKPLEAQLNKPTEGESDETPDESPEDESDEAPEDKIKITRMGSDISRYALNQANKEEGSAGADLVEQDLEEGIPFAANSLDIVAAADVVEHTKSRQHTFNEIARVIKPGGLLVLSIPITDTALGRLLWNKLDVDPTHISIGTKDEVKQELKKAGFEVTSEGGFFGGGYFKLPFATNVELTARYVGKPKEKKNGEGNSEEPVSAEEL